MKQFCYLVVFICCFSAPAFPQVTWENQVWTSMGVTYDFSKKASLSFDTEGRYDAGLHAVSTWFPELEFSHRLAKSVNAAIRYRYNHDLEEPGNPVTSHRFSLDLDQNFDYGKLEAVIRLRVSHETIKLLPEAEDEEDYVTRQKLTLKYKLGDLKPYVSAEIFQSVFPSSGYITQQRISCGLDYKLNKRIRISAWSMYQNLISIKRINFGAGVNYRLKRAGKEKVKSQPVQE